MSPFTLLVGKLRILIVIPSVALKFYCLNTCSNLAKVSFIGCEVLSFHLAGLTRSVSHVWIKELRKEGD